MLKYVRVRDLKIGDRIIESNEWSIVKSMPYKDDEMDCVKILYDGASSEDWIGESDGYWLTIFRDE